MLRGAADAVVAGERLLEALAEPDGVVVLDVGEVKNESETATVPSAVSTSTTIDSRWWAPDHHARSPGAISSLSSSSRTRSQLSVTRSTSVGSGTSASGCRAGGRAWCGSAPSRGADADPGLAELLQRAGGVQLERRQQRVRDVFRLSPALASRTGRWCRLAHEVAGGRVDEVAHAWEALAHVGVVVGGEVLTMAVIPWPWISVTLSASGSSWSQRPSRTPRGRASATARAEHAHGVAHG